jgi:hypothetical protein
MASFSQIDRSLASAVSDLHDYLWAGKKLPEARLLERLERGAKDLDRFVGARGAIASGIRPLLQDFRKHPTGPDLFTFCEAVCDLSAAVEYGVRDPKAAVTRASNLAVSLAIGLASAADRFDLVEEFEGGTTDFSEFTSRLADVLEEKGVLRAGEFRRAVNGPFDINALWDAQATKDAQRIGAIASAASAGLACVLYVDALRALGRYREAPYAKLVPATRRILERLGGHA